jgi:hypothetical protein
MWATSCRPSRARYKVGAENRLRLTDDGVRAFITEIDSAFKDTLKSKIIGNELWGREHGIEARNWVIYSVDP